MGLNNLTNEREKLKDASLGQKLAFFWDYYRWPVISVLIVLGIIVSFVYPALTAKDVVLSGVCLNCYQSSFETSYDTLTEEFLRSRELDPAEYEVELNMSLIYVPGDEAISQDNYQTIQRLGAQVTAGELDFIVGNLDAVLELADSGALCDLSQLWGAEELASYEPYLQYAEPEGMEAPVPMLIDVSGCGALMENYPYLQEPLVLGAAVNAPHEEMIRELVSFLIDESK